VAASQFQAVDSLNSPLDAENSSGRWLMQQGVLPVSGARVATALWPACRTRLRGKVN